MEQKPPAPHCSRCNVRWQKSGTTHCWSGDPETRPPAPADCPTTQADEVVAASFNAYRGDDEDARIARVAARVEGLCYQPLPGTSAVNARWTRVEDTIAFAKLMDYQRVGVATCIGLLDETARLTAVLEAQGFEVVSACCKAGSIDKLELDIDEPTEEFLEVDRSALAEV